jgi:hypothetical protein
MRECRLGRPSTHRKDTYLDTRKIPSEGSGGKIHGSTKIRGSGLWMMDKERGGILEKKRTQPLPNAYHVYRGT